VDADWPDAPHRMGPPPDHFEDPAAGPTRTAGLLPVPAEDPGTPQIQIIGTPPAPLRPGRVVAGLAVAAVFLAGSAVALTRMVTHPDPAPPHLVVAAPPDPGPRTALTLTAATFELADDTGDLRVTVGPLGDQPIRVSAGLTTLTGATVRLSVPPTGPARVDVVLNNRITWAVRMTGGVQHAGFDLRGGAVSRFDLIGGATRIDMTLPRSGRVVPIRMSGGVHTWRIHTTGEVPVHARFRRGAGPVDLNGHQTPA
jgi:hypothetical protein